MQNAFSIALLESILGRWIDPTIDTQIAAHVASTGLSGAQVWRVRHGKSEYCLKCWPLDQCSAAQLVQRHDLLRYVHDAGFRLVPRPAINRHGKTVEYVDGCLWDLTTWLPGSPYDPQNLDEGIIRQAMGCLAEFHNAASGFSEPAVAPSPGLQTRLRIARELSTGGGAALRAAVDQHRRHPWHDLLKELLAETECVVPSVVAQLERAARRPLPTQWCLRDVKYDHVLFEDGEVSGLIDYGAATVDAVSSDVARLIGSILGRSDDRWEAAVHEYQSHRPLSAAELE
ncbi:MAG: phosphotransferase, partial [Caulobacterales bacterium]|nr:phosphotransferase [Caulobacterales bacterium]